MNIGIMKTNETLEDLDAGIQNGYRFFSACEFNDSQASFVKVLTDLTLAVAISKNEEATCREYKYITALRIKGAMPAAASSAVRTMELHAYMALCRLQPVHTLLVLRSAMVNAYKHKQYTVAAGFSQRLLELPDMECTQCGSPLQVLNANPELGRESGTQSCATSCQISTTRPI